MRVSKKNRLYLLSSLLISTLICSYPFYRRRAIDRWLERYNARAYYTYQNWVGNLPDFARELFEDIDVLIIEKVNVEDFDNIGSFNKLRILNIEYSTVDNPKIILQLKNLEILHCKGSNLTDELLQEFRAINSTCEINQW